MDINRNMINLKFMSAPRSEPTDISNARTDMDAYMRTKLHIFTNGRYGRKKYSDGVVSLMKIKP